MVDGEVIIDVSLDNEGFVKGAKQLKGQLGGLTSVANKLGIAIAAAFSVRALVNFSRECIEIGSSIAEVQNVVDVAFGEMSDKVEEFAASAITNYGMSTLAAKKTASTYMAMAKNMGFSMDAASDMAITLAGLTGDVASFYNISQQLADVKLKSVFTGETETLKDLGIVMTQANLQAYAMQKGIAKSVSQMTQAELVALRYNFVLDQLSMASGDFIRTQDSWANQTRILSMQWQEFMGIIGQTLTQVLLPAVKLMNQGLSLLISWGNQIAALFGGTTEQVQNTESISTGIAGAVENQEALTKATKETNEEQAKSLASFDEINKLSGDTASAASVGSVDISGIGTTTLPVEPVISEGSVSKFFDDFKAALAPAEEALGRLFESMSAFGGTAKDGLLWVWDNILTPLGTWAANEALPAFLDLLAAGFDFLTAACVALQPAWQWIWDNFLAPIANWSGDLVVAGLRELTDLLRDITSLISGEITFGEFISNLTPVQTALLGIATALGAITIANTAGKGLNAITACFASIKKGNGIIGKLYEVFALTAGGAGTLGEAIKAVFGPGSIIAGIAAIIGGAVLAITNFAGMLENGFSWAQEALMLLGIALVAVGAIILGAPAMIAGVIAAIVAAVATAVVVVKEHWTEIKDWFINAWEAIKDCWSKVGGWFDTKVIQPVKSNFKSFINGLIGMVEGFCNFFIRGINKIISALNGLSFDTPDWVPVIGGKTFGLSLKKFPEMKLPRLAEGAVIPANREFLAVLGDQTSGNNIEAPESLIRKIVREEAGGNYTELLEAILAAIKAGKIMRVDKRTLARITAEGINDLTRSSGEPILIF